MARNHTKQLPEGLRQEMEDWKRQMMGAIQDRMDTLQVQMRVFLFHLDPFFIPLFQSCSQLTASAACLSCFFASSLCLIGIALFRQGPIYMQRERISNWFHSGCLLTRAWLRYMNVLFCGLKQWHVCRLLEGQSRYQWISWGFKSCSWKMLSPTWQKLKPPLLPAVQVPSLISALLAFQSPYQRATPFLRLLRRMRYAEGVLKPHAFQIAPAVHSAKSCLQYD